MKQWNGIHSVSTAKQNGKHSENKRVSELNVVQRERIPSEAPSVRGLKLGENRYGSAHKIISHGAARTTHRHITLSTRLKEHGNIKTRSGVMALDISTYYR